MSDTKNHPDQPTVCWRCDKPIKKSDQNAFYYYDDTKAKKHRSQHHVC